MDTVQFLAYGTGVIGIIFLIAGLFWGRMRLAGLMRLPFHVIGAGIAMVAARYLLIDWLISDKKLSEASFGIFVLGLLCIVLAPWFGLGFLVMDGELPSKATAPLVVCAVGSVLFLCSCGYVFLANGLAMTH